MRPLKIENILYFFVICGILFIGTGCSNNSNADSAQDTYQDILEQAQADIDAAHQTLEEIQNGMSSDTEATFEMPDVDYTEISPRQMFSDMKENPIKAEATYLDQYLVIQGYFQYDLLEDSFSMTDNVIESENIIFCTLVNGESAPKNISHGTRITVWGRVTELDPDEKSYRLDTYKFEVEPEIPADNAEYISVTIDEMIDACEDDSYEAQEKYLGKYVTFSAYIDSIDLDGVSLNEDPPQSDLLSGIIRITDGFISGAFATDEVKMSFADLEEGASVTIWGKITDIAIAETFGAVIYDIDIIKVK